MAGDALGGFNLAEAAASSARFETAKACRIPVGKRLAIGRLRLSRGREVQLELEQRAVR